VLSERLPTHGAVQAHEALATTRDAVTPSMPLPAIFNRHHVHLRTAAGSDHLTG